MSVVMFMMMMMMMVIMVMIMIVAVSHMIFLHIFWIDSTLNPSKVPTDVCLQPQITKRCPKIQKDSKVFMKPNNEVLHLSRA